MTRAPDNWQFQLLADSLLNETDAKGAPLSGGKGAGGIGSPDLLNLITSKQMLIAPGQTGVDETDIRADLDEWEARKREEHNYVTLYCASCGETKAVAVYCKNRFCPVCSSARKYRIKDRLNYLIQWSAPTQTRTLKLVTLTQPKQPDLSAGLKRILLAFKRLRAHKFWRTHVEAGAFVVEVKGTSGCWHIHIHAIVVGRFLPAFQLSDAWSVARGGQIVDVRRIPPDKAIGYVIKYVTKPSVSPEHIDELANAFRGARLFSVFGSWHNQKQPKRVITCHCQVCSGTTWHAVWNIGDCSDRDREAFLKSLRDDWIRGRRAP